MGERSGIQWTDATWNPTTGCDRVSPGCDNCYALTLAERLQAMGSRKYQNDGSTETSGPGFRFTEHSSALDQPLRWQRPRRVFVNSMSDLFHPEASDLFIAEVFAVMSLAPQHQFQLLTKRSKSMSGVLADLGGDFRLKMALTRKRMTPSRDVPPLTWPLPNVWLGVSIENDRYAFRARHLAEAPAAVRFLSCEPLLGPLPSLDLSGIDWCIVGGESGRNARPLELDWIRKIRQKCRDAGTALFIKQLGTAWSHETGHGRTHGGDWNIWPADLRIREMPYGIPIAAAATV